MGVKSGVSSTFRYIYTYIVYYKKYLSIDRQESLTYRPPFNDHFKISKLTEWQKISKLTELTKKLYFFCSLIPGLMEEKTH